MKIHTHLIPMLSTSLLFAAALSCGAAKKGDEGGIPGASHKNADGSDGTGDASGDDIDTPMSSQFADAGAEDPGPASLVTFVLKNSGKEELFLNMDKGWQAVIYAYSGTPPNAKSILMFPTHCTASCDAGTEEICPYCPEPERVKDIKEAENHDAVAPGDTREVPWDGVAFAYKKARGTREGKKARCKCYTETEPPPETYTVKACGLRKTKTAKAHSKYQCVETTLTWPVQEPTRIELDFGA